MHKIYLILLLVLSSKIVFSQGENCSAAVTLVNGACVAGTPGLTQNIVGCVGNADDDSWYKFVASATSHSLTVTGSAGYDAVLQFFSGTCSSLISGACVDNTLSGQAESMIASGLTIGNTYYVRVYHYFAGSGAGTFTMCLNNAPAPPANDNCASAINLAVNAGCIQTAGSTYGATTQTLYPACSGTANDDVWYTFTATNYTQTIQVAGSAAMDPVIELYDGSCGSFSSLSCTDNTFSGGTETATATGLVPGVQYFFRVFDYYSTAGNSFSVCVSGNSIIAGTQPNDEPCGAILLPPVTADCNYSMFSNVGATLTSTVTTPAPTGCTGGTGGFGATTKDVWFAITVPASGNLCITPIPNYTTSPAITDGVMALYSGSCGSLTQIACSDDADGTAGIYNYPGTANDFLPYINATGLTPGTTVFLRYWGWAGASGDFGLCVQAPTNDLCANALYICDINGYSASTSPAFTPDRPGTGTGQMFGNNENSAGVDQPNGTNTGGIFGYYPFPGTTPGPYSSPAIDVNIENNSWIKFTAASPTIALQVSVYDCWVNTAGNQGVQMQIFSGTNCSSFTPVSSFQEGIGTYTVNATSLTVGNNYYLMVDGWGGNICNYNIQAIAGVAFPAITAVPGSICPGQSSILTAPSGASGYTWEPTGETTQTISVAPGTTMTYTCYVGGVCGYKQTLTKTVTMLAAPSVSINAGAAISTCGTQTLTLTGGGASTYSWSTGNTTTSFTTAPTGNTTYSVIGTAANGCTNTAVSNVTVNTVPTILPAGTNTICNGGNTTLTVSGANTYTWSPSATLSASTGTAVTATPTTGTNYTVTATAANGCTNTTTYSVTVNAKPTVSSTTTGSVICDGNATTVNGTGASTYTWTGGITDGVAFTPTTTATYTVIGTSAATGCTNTAVRTITVTPTPTVNTTASNSVICNGQSTTLSGTGATTYTWSGGISNGVAFSPTTTTTYTVTGATAGCTNTAVRTITVNNLPTVSSTVTNSVICNGGSTTLSGTGATTYTWTGGVTNGAVFSPTTTTNYTVTGTDGNGCVNTSVRSVTVNPLPTVSSTASSSVICNGGSTTLSGTGANSYAWSGGITDGVAFTPTVTTTYTVTGTNAATGCTNTAVRTVTVNTPPTVSSTTTNSVICLGASTSLSGTGASTYTWTGGITNGASFSPTTTTSYTVTGTAINGCTNTAVGTITVNPLPTVSSTASNSVICNGSSTILNGTGASTYTWTGGITNGAAFSPTTTTTYTVTGTDANGCVNTSVRTVTVNSIPTSTASTSGTITCATNTVNLNSTSTAGASYTWTAPGGSSISSGTNSINAVGQGAGTYTLNVLSAAGCAYSTTLATNINTTVPTASASNGTLTCAQTSTVLTGGPSAGVTYNWSGPGILGSNTTANITATVTGNYTLVTTSTLTGCSSTVSAIGTVTNNLTTPTVTAGSNQIITCAAPSVTLTGSATGGSNLSWTNGATTNTTTVGGAGIYTLTATNPGTGCFSTSTVQVLPSAGTPTGNVSAASNSITCSLTSASISITSTISPLTYSWTGPGTIASPTSSATTVSSGGTYTITITNTASCSQSYPVVVPTNTTPVVASASVAASSSITCNTTSLTLSSLPTGANYSYSWTGPNILSGANTANPVVGTGGSYSVTITNTITGCSGASGTTNVSVPSNTATPTLSLSATSVTTTCSAPNTTVTVTSNSNPNTTYTWTAPGTGTINNPSIGNPTISGSGIFTVAITNTVNGCSSVQATVAVTSDANIPSYTLSTSATTVNCTNPNPGATITSSVTGLTYSWSPAPATGGNTASPTFTAAGNYTAVVTNTANGCSTNVPMVAVSLNTTVPTATATPASSITCSSTSVSISSTVTPASNVAYSWSGPNVISGGTTLNPTIGSGGSYTIAMTNTVNGCTNSYTTNVPTNTTVPTLSLTANSLTTTCAVPNATFNASSSAGSATYSWTSPGSGSLNSNTSANPVASGSGVFTVSVTNPVNGCVSASQTATLTADANIPTFSLPNNTATITCAALTPSVSLTSTVSGVTYSWSPSPSSGITTASPTFTAPGSYTCLITNPTNSCSTNGAVVIVSQNTIAPTAAATPASSITCSSVSIVISSTITPATNVTYSWTGPNVISGGTTLSPTIGTGGSYVIAMTNTVNGCTNNYTVNVPTNTTVPTMSLSTNAFTTTCSAPSVAISATSDADPITSYSWTAPGTGTISNTSISNPTVGGNGVFTVTATNSVNGCISAVGTVSITADANIPTFTLSANVATVSCTVPTPSVSLTTSVTGVTYQWSPTPASGGNTATPTFTASGNYTCVITNTVNNCSTNLPQVAVNINTIAPTLSVTPNVSITCALNTVTITSTGTAGTYSWSGSGIVGSTTSSSITANATGVYTLIVTDPINGCSTTTTSSVGTNTNSPTLTATSTSSVINCSTGSTTLTAISTITPTWLTPSGSAANPLVVSTSGDYTATVTDPANGCSTQYPITITNNVVQPDANAGAATTIPCSSTSVTLLGSSTTTDVVSYSWTGSSAGSITSGSNTANPIVTGTGVYTLTVTNLSNGCTATSTVNVTQGNVTAAFTEDVTTGEAPLTVNFTDGSTGATSYSWDFGNGSFSSSQNPNTLFDVEGSYTVTLIASSSLCSDTVSHVITVENGFTIEVPNVFTPNGDGANDVFKIKITGVKSAEGSIYNRWGQLLFKWDVLNASWDGKASNGENCPDATYFYIIKVIDKKDKEHQAPGYVLITR